MATKDIATAPKRKATIGLWNTYGWAVKLFASATSVIAGLIAFGFFSEAALYEMAGLPRLSADPIYLAEAGARGLVSSLAAVRGEGVLVLVALLAFAYAGLSARDRPRPSRLLRSPELLVGAQALALVAVIVLVSTLVAVAGLGTARGRDRVERQVLAEIGGLRDQEDWTPTYELERIETLRMAPTALARSVRSAGEWLRYALPPWGSEVEAGEPSLGFPLRPPESLRRQSRDFYGWLVVGAIVLPGLVLLLLHWRAWAADRVPLRLLEDTMRYRLPGWLQRRYAKESMQN